MNPEVIKSFLVNLGFDVDEKSLAAFVKSIAVASAKVTALAVSIEATAGIIAKGITNISSDFEELGYQYRIITPAINKAIVLRRELFKAYGAAGINIQRTVLSALRLNMSLTKTKYALDAIYKSVGAKFFGLITKQSDNFRKILYGNMPKIQSILEHLVNFIFKMVDSFTQLFLRLWKLFSSVYDYLVRFNKSLDGLPLKVAAIGLAWKILNGVFEKSPLGKLILAIGTIISLWDDFKVWEKVGKGPKGSFFDWSSFVPTIYAVRDAIKSVSKVIQDLWAVIKDVGQSINLYFNGIGDSWKKPLVKAGFELSKWMKDLSEASKKEMLSVLDLGKWSWSTGGHLIENMFDNIWKNIEATPGMTTPGRGESGGPGLGVPPLFSPKGGSNSKTNNLHSQTNIYTQPGADAQTIGRVSGDTTKTNFTLVANMQNNIGAGVIA